MRFFSAQQLILIAFVLLVAAFESAAGLSRNEPWFKPNPEIRSSPYHARSRLGGSRLLPRRMYRSAPGLAYEPMVQELPYDDITDAE